MQLQSILVREIFIAVPSDRDENPVRVFATFTEDLNEMARWLVNCRITTVAMESTGVYWTPLYDVLEQYGIKPCLVDARNRKNVPGRRTDWHECQWLQYLHSVGLLRAALISDITGLTGLSIVDAILDGQRDPVELAKLRDPHIRASKETIRKSLVGNWRPEHLFTLKQARQMYQHYREQMRA